MKSIEIDTLKVWCSNPDMAVKKRASQAEVEAHIEDFIYIWTVLISENTTPVFRAKDLIKRTEKTTPFEKGNEIRSHHRSMTPVILRKSITRYAEDKRHSLDRIMLPEILE